MRSLRPLLVACAAVAALLVLPGQALAISPVTTDCNAHTKLTHHYSVSELRTALATMPADVKEYTGCYQVIEDQLFLQLGKKPPNSGSTSSSNGGSSSFLSTPVLIAVILVIVLGGVLAFIAARRAGSPAISGLSRASE